MGRYVNRLRKDPPGPDTTGWKERHTAALKCPGSLEVPVVHLFTGWCDYADAHRACYASGIGEDGVLGPEWAAIGAAMRGLLNGECGRLDCGMLDAVLCDTLRDEGFDPDAL